MRTCSYIFLTCAIISFCFVPTMNAQGVSTAFILKSPPSEGGVAAELADVGQFLILQYSQAANFTYKYVDVALDALQFDTKAYLFVAASQKRVTGVAPEELVGLVNVRDGVPDDKSAWTIESASGKKGPIVFGDTVFVKNAYFGLYLYPDGMHYNAVTLSKDKFEFAIQSVRTN